MSNISLERVVGPKAVAARIPIVDCDVHQNQPPDALLPYLPPFFRKRGVVSLARDEYNSIFKFL